jgi:hypothetical protein
MFVRTLPHLSVSCPARRVHPEFRPCSGISGMSKGPIKHIFIPLVDRSAIAPKKAASYFAMMVNAGEQLDCSDKMV